MKQTLEVNLRLLFLIVFASLIPTLSQAATTFSDRIAFEKTLGTSLTDDYENPGYYKGSFLSIWNDADMSAVLREVSYKTTAFLNTNIITDNSVNNNRYYCSGCNGSFELDFTTTSVGDSNGVFGVGFNYLSDGTPPYMAFVTYGDGSTENIFINTSDNFDTFFGLSSDLLIQTIHIGLIDGKKGFYSHFNLDNLTIGSSISVVPLPAGLPLFAAGLAFIGFVSRRKNWRR